MLGLLAACCLVHAVCVSAVLGEMNGWLARFVSELLSDLAMALSVLTTVAIASLSLVNLLLLRKWSVPVAVKAVAIAAVPAVVSLTAAGLLVLAEPALLAWVVLMVRGEPIAPTVGSAITELAIWSGAIGYWLACPAFALAAGVADDASPRAWERAIRASDGGFDPIKAGMVQLAPCILFGGLAVIAILERFLLRGLAEQVFRWLDTKYVPMLIAAAVIVPGLWIATRAWRLLGALYWKEPGGRL